MADSAYDSARTKAHWDKRAKDFGRFDGTLDDYASRIFNIFAEHGITLPGKTVLDIGCGSGRFAMHMAQMGADVTAMDISPEMLKNAKESAKQYGIPVKFVESDWIDYKGAEKYDILFCSLTPAIHNDETREKLLHYAREWIVYIAFSPDDPHRDPLEELYTAHGIRPRVLVGAAEMHDWLKRRGIKYFTHSFDKARSVQEGRDAIIDKAATGLREGGVEPDMALIESYIERFKDENGGYQHKRVSLVDMIIFKP